MFINLHALKSKDLAALQTALKAKAKRNLLIHYFRDKQTKTQTVLAVKGVNLRNGFDVELKICRLIQIIGNKSFKNE